MPEGVIRVGRVSSVDAERGMAAVTYPDMGGATTAPLPVFNFDGEYKMPKVGDSVLALHLPSGMSSGIVMGAYWHDKSRPPSGAAWRKELGAEPGEAYMELLPDGTLRIHAARVVLEAGEIALDAPATRYSGELEKGGGG